MAFYDKFRLVESFTYKKLRVELYRAIKGGYCEKCELDHEPHDLRCSSCGDEITPSAVFLIKVSGKDVGIECSTKEEAAEIAKAWIDDYTDDPSSPEEDEEPDDALLPTDKTKGGKNRRRWIEGGGPGGKANPLVAGARKLGWGKKALAILRGRDP
ncbi:MAG: hypothetical protein RL272_170 [Candidatus Parcubacteria bacterium]|jgi:hypothetical protein